MFVYTKQLSSQWMDFRYTLQWGVLLKPVKKIQFRLKLDKNKGHFIRRPKCISLHLLLDLWELTLVAMGAKPLPPHLLIS
jgi:hypothetical protein